MTRSSVPASSASRSLFLRQDECIALMVKDDGSPTEGASSAEAMAGRELLRIRAGAIGGTLTITSQPNEGTTILCTLPQPN